MLHWPHLCASCCGLAPIGRLISRARGAVPLQLAGCQGPRVPWGQIGQGREGSPISGAIEPIGRCHCASQARLFGGAPMALKSVVALGAAQTRVAGRRADSFGKRN